MADILIGVSGGIAAYKACDVVRLCVKAGFDVHVVMTQAAQRFVTPTTFAALSSHHVSTSLFDDELSPVPHIDLARQADLICIVPATASTMARLAQGSADDLLSATVLAANVPVVLAPGMNTVMWESQASQDNLKILKQRGVHVVGPVEGLLACGETGNGNLAEPGEIFRTICSLVTPSSALRGYRVLITAGPTHEAIDPVRYIANSSTGKMGFSLARTAAMRGADVDLVAGPVHLDTPAGVNRTDVVSAQQMHQAACELARSADIIICCAAVSDYRPENAASHKLKKSKDPLTCIQLVENPDILRDLIRLCRDDSQDKHHFVVGFAAETNNLIAYAREKLESKGADMIVANDVSRSESTFGADTNKVAILTPDGIEELPTLGLDEVSGCIFDRIARQMGQTGSADI